MGESPKEGERLDKMENLLEEKNRKENGTSEV